MNLVIQIRGWSGSGKSTIIQKLFEEFCPAEIFEDGKVIGYSFGGSTRKKLYVVGPYTKTGGGCDSISPVSRIDELITRFAAKGNVIFEGAMISTIAGRWAKLAESLPNTNFIFLVLDTPLERCLKRIKKRRERKGNTKPFNPTPANLHHYQEARFSSPRNLKEAGADVRIINHKKAFKTILKLLGEKC